MQRDHSVSGPTISGCSQPYPGPPVDLREAANGQSERINFGTAHFAREGRGWARSSRKSPIVAGRLLSDRRRSARTVADPADRQQPKLSASTVTGPPALRRRRSASSQPVLSGVTKPPKQDFSDLVREARPESAYQNKFGFSPSGCAGGIPWSSRARAQLAQSPASTGSLQDARDRVPQTLSP